MQRKTVIPMPPATKTSGVAVSSGSRKDPFGCSTSTSVPTGSSASDRLNAVSRRRVHSPRWPWSFGDVTTEMCRFGPFSSSYGGSSSVTQKYCPASKSTVSPCRSKRTRSVPFATSRFSEMRARMTTGIYASARRADCRNRILRRMEPADYHAWTRALRDALGGDDRVVGLVAVGSMADRDYGPDRYSDHDFFVVSTPGGQEALRRDLSWLPAGRPVALTLRETEHGLKVVYDDGHLLEFAVFDLEELGLARVNRYRVLLDRGGVTERMAEVARERVAPETIEHAFGMLVTNVLVGDRKSTRGEALSGAFFVKSLSVRWLVVLVTQIVPAEASTLL